MKKILVCLAISLLVGATVFISSSRSPERSFDLLTNNIEATSVCAAGIDCVGASGSCMIPNPREGGWFFLTGNLTVYN